MAQAARKVTAKDANEKQAQRRLTVLELAERLGNVAETIGHRADEPNAVVGFPDTEPLPGEAGDADFVRGRKR